jgi:hypothetical protein
MIVLEIIISWYKYHEKHFPADKRKAQLERFIRLPEGEKKSQRDRRDRGCM